MRTSFDRAISSPQEEDNRFNEHNERIFTSEQVETRSRNARAAYRFEQSLQVKAEWEEAALNEYLDSLGVSDAVQNAFRAIQRQYAEEKQHLNSVEHELHTLTKGELGKSLSPTDAGEALFHFHVRKKPVGKVMLHREDTYFIVFFENSEDYKSLDTTIDDDGEDSKGTYHEYMQLSVENGASALMIEGIDEPGQKATIRHEFSHHITNFLDVQLESGSPFPRLVREELQDDEDIIKNIIGVKDEVLAHIREGAPSTSFAREVNDYPYVRELPQPLQDTVRSIVVDIGVELAIMGYDAIPVEEQEALIYHVIDLELIDIPAYFAAYNEEQRVDSDDIEEIMAAK